MIRIETIKIGLAANYLMFKDGAWRSLQVEA